MISIRAAQISDIPALVGLLETLFAVEADFDFDGEKQRRGLELFLSDNTMRRIFVAQFEGAVVGIATVQLMVSTAEGTYSGWVEDVIVAEVVRGQGVGTRLLDAINDWCRENGATRVQLLYDVQNEPALAFYTRTGWQGTQLKLLRRFLV